MEPTTTFRETAVATDSTLLFNNLHPSVSWRSIVAGVLISLFSFAVLASLGVAIGGITLGVDDPNYEFAGGASVVWMVLATAISLFVASYFAARISNFRPRRIGMAQAAVVTAIFFGLMLTQSAMIVGSLGRTAGALIGGAAATAGAAASQSTMLSNLIEDNVADLTSVEDTNAFVMGLGNRLLRGDSEGAKAYLAAQTDMTPAQVDERINALNAKVDAAMIDARKKAAVAMQASGWAMFATLLLGLVAALAGGAWGSGVNLRLPMTVDDTTKTKAYGTPSYAS